MLHAFLIFVGAQKRTIFEEEQKQLIEAESELLRCEAKIEEYSSAADMYKKRIVRLNKRMNARKPSNVTSIEKKSVVRNG